MDRRRAEGPPAERRCAGAERGQHDAFVHGRGAQLEALDLCVLIFAADATAAEIEGPWVRRRLPAGVAGQLAELQRRLHVQEQGYPDRVLTLQEQHVQCEAVVELCKAVRLIYRTHISFEQVVSPVDGGCS